MDTPLTSKGLYNGHLKGGAYVDKRTHMVPRPPQRQCTTNSDSPTIPTVKGVALEKAASFERPKQFPGVGRRTC